MQRIAGINEELNEILSVCKQPDTGLTVAEISCSQDLAYDLSQMGFQFFNQKLIEQEEIEPPIETLSEESISTESEESEESEELEILPTIVTSQLIVTIGDSVENWFQIEKNIKSLKCETRYRSPYNVLNNIFTELLYKINLCETNCSTEILNDSE